MPPMTRPSTIGGRGQPSRFMSQPTTPKTISVKRSPQSWVPSKAATNTSDSTIGSRISGRTVEILASQRLHERQISAPITWASVRLHTIV